MEKDKGFYSCNHNNFIFMLLTMYPNPFKNQFHIQLKEYIITKNVSRKVFIYLK